jgi:hypothetical protein
VAELTWIADHGFKGTYAPGFLNYGSRPALRRVLGAGLGAVRGAWSPLFVHAGFGQAQAASSLRSLASSTRSTPPEDRHRLVTRLKDEVFVGDFADVSAPADGQLMFGG